MNSNKAKKIRREAKWAMRGLIKPRPKWIPFNVYIWLVKLFLVTK